MAIGPLLIHQAPVGTSFDANYGLGECLKALVTHLHKKQQSSTTNGIKIYRDNTHSHMKDMIFNYF